LASEENSETESSTEEGTGFGDRQAVQLFNFVGGFGESAYLIFVLLVGCSIPCLFVVIKTTLFSDIVMEGRYWILKSFLVGVGCAIGLAIGFMFAGGEGPRETVVMWILIASLSFGFILGSCIFSSFLFRIDARKRPYFTAITGVPVALSFMLAVYFLSNGEWPSIFLSCWGMGATVLRLMGANAPDSESSDVD